MENDNIVSVFCKNLGHVVKFQCSVSLGWPSEQKLCGAAIQHREVKIQYTRKEVRDMCNLLINIIFFLFTQVDLAGIVIYKCVLSHAPPPATQGPLRPAEHWNLAMGPQPKSCAGHACSATQVRPGMPGLGPLHTQHSHILRSQMLFSA